MNDEYQTVLQICFSRCYAVTPHDLYEKCLKCRQLNQQKKSPADRERERNAAKRALNKQSGLTTWDFGL